MRTSIPICVRFIFSHNCCLQAVVMLVLGLGQGQILWPWPWDCGLGLALALEVWPWPKIQGQHLGGLQCSPWTSIDSSELYFKIHDPYLHTGVTHGRSWRYSTSFIPNRDGLGLGLGTVALALALIVFGLGPGLDQLALALALSVTSGLVNITDRQVFVTFR